VLALLRGDVPPPALLANTCYSLAGADYGISIAGVYRAVDDRFAPMQGSVGTSRLGAAPEVRAREARYAFDWYETIVRDTFG
jgi:sulfide dehydrogenase [flavocytochrome c] flavoprotein chain